MQKIKILAFIGFFCCFLGVRLVAQTDTTQNQRYPGGVFFFGGIGPAIPVGGFGEERESGFDLNTAMSYRFRDGLLLRGMFDFSTFRFDPGTITQAVGGETYEIGGSNNLISLLVSAGYYLPLKRFTPYGFAGLGVSFVSKPFLELDENRNEVNINQEVNGYFSHVVGVGMDFTLNPPGPEWNQKKAIYIIYLETFYTQIPRITDVSKNRFQLVSVNVGIKTTF